MLSKLLSKVNKQLEDHKLKVKISQGAIIDATLIDAAVNSKAKPNLIVEDRKEDDNDQDGGESNPTKILMANEQSNDGIDKDAKWLKKGKNSLFGYKGFITTDAQDGYIESVAVINHYPPNKNIEISVLVMYY